MSAAKTNATERKAVFLIVDRPLCRHGMAALVNAEDDMFVSGAAEDVEAGIDILREKPAAIAVLDVTTPGASVADLVKTLHAALPGLPILVIAAQTDPLHALRALRAGAKGFVTKRESAEQFATAVRKVMGAQLYLSAVFSEQLISELARSDDGDLRSPLDRLTEREVEVLRLLGEGGATRAIAEKLGLSVKTVETHRSHIKEKLGLRTAAELLRYAIEWTSGR